MLSLHIFKEFLLPLFCALLAFSLLFLLNDLFDDASDFGGKSAPALVMLKYFLCKLPVNLPHVIPVSVLLASSFMTVMLAKNNELYAMRSAGLSLALCATPVWLSAALLSLSVWLLSESLVPRCQEAIMHIQQEWLSKKSAVKQGQKLFKYIPGERDWFFGDYRGLGSSGQVVLRQNRPEGGSAWVLTAKSANYAEGEWHFEQGEFFAYENAPAGKQQRLAPQSFERRSLRLPESAETIAEQSKELETLRASEIRNIIKSGLLGSQRAEKQLRVMLWHRWTFPLASLVGALFGFVLTLGHGRSSYMKGFASAVAALVLYFVLAQFFLVLGKNGWLPPFLAGAFFPLIFLAGGLVLLWQRQ